MALTIDDVINELDPEERQKLQREQDELLEAVFLPRLIRGEPQRLDIALSKIADGLPPERLIELAEFFNAQAEKKKKQQNGSSSPEKGQ